MNGSCYRSIGILVYICSRISHPSAWTLSVCSDNASVLSTSAMKNDAPPTYSNSTSVYNSNELPLTAHMFFPYFYSLYNPIQQKHFLNKIKDNE